MKTIHEGVQRVRGRFRGKNGKLKKERITTDADRRKR